jgi:hypothetical protein
LINFKVSFEIEVRCDLFEESLSSFFGEVRDSFEEVLELKRKE